MKSVGSCSISSYIRGFITWKNHDPHAYHYHHPQSSLFMNQIDPFTHNYHCVYDVADITSYSVCNWFYCCRCIITRLLCLCVAEIQEKLPPKSSSDLSHCSCQNDSHWRWCSFTSFHAKNGMEGHWVSSQEAVLVCVSGVIQDLPK